jgi:hypothetical protein
MERFERKKRGLTRALEECRTIRNAAKSVFRDRSTTAYFRRAVDEEKANPAEVGNTDDPNAGYEDTEGVDDGKEDDDEEEEDEEDPEELKIDRIRPAASMMSSSIDEISLASMVSFASPGVIKVGSGVEKSNPTPPTATKGVRYGRKVVVEDGDDDECGGKDDSEEVAGRVESSSIDAGGEFERDSS